MSPDKLPQSPEKQDVPKPFLDKADAFMTQMSGFEHNSDEAFRATEKFIDTILPADGEVIEGRTDSFSREQMIDQFAVYFEEGDKLPEDRDVDPASLITSKGGLREAITAIMNNTDTKMNFRQQMMLRVEELDKERDQAEALRSPQNMHKVGGAELDAADVDEPIPGAGDPLAEGIKAATGIIDSIPDSIKNPTKPVPLPPPAMISEIPKKEVQAAAEPAVESLSVEQRIDMLTEGLSDQDKAALNDFWTATITFQRAEYKREFDNAADAKRDRFSAQQRMSPAAKAIAGQYINYSYERNAKK